MIKCTEGFRCCCRWIQYSENRWIGNWSSGWAFCRYRWKFIGRFVVFEQRELGVLLFPQSREWHSALHQRSVHAFSLFRLVVDWAFCRLRCAIIGRSAVTAQLRIERFAAPHNRRQNFESLYLGIFFLNPRAHWAFYYSAGELGKYKQLLAI